VTAPALIAEPSLRERIRAYVEPRAAEVDANRASVRDGLAFVGGLGLSALGVDGCERPADLERAVEAIGTIAQYDVSQAFAFWCHRMGVEYLHQAPPGTTLRDHLLPRVLAGEVAGSTSFAGAMAHYLGGAPMPLTFRRDGPDLLVSGRIAWASNLEAPFVSVSAAANADDPSDRVVFAYTESTAGVAIADYPPLLALQATASSSPLFTEARITPRYAITKDFEGFARTIFPVFILLQSAFCWGLASRSLAEAGSRLTGQAAVVQPEYEALRARFTAAEARMREAARSADRARLPVRDLLELRLDLGTLCVSAVALEAKVSGGRGYMSSSDTARRLREAAFLPVQSPTEIQLRWLLSRSAS